MLVFFGTQTSNMKSEIIRLWWQYFKSCVNFQKQLIVFLSWVTIASLGVGLVLHQQNSWHWLYTVHWRQLFIIGWSIVLDRALSSLEHCLNLSWIERCHGRVLDACAFCPSPLSMKNKRAGMGRLQLLFHDLQVSCVFCSTVCTCLCFDLLLLLSSLQIAYRRVRRSDLNPLFRQKIKTIEGTVVEHLRKLLSLQALP